MSLDLLLRDLATRVATQDKLLKTLINGNSADLAALATTNKGNLVAALNELHGAVQDAAESGGAPINDDSPSTVSTYSSTKIEAAIVSAREALLGGAGTAYDTLQELATLLQDTASDADVASIMTAMGNRVRFDAVQALTAPQQAQARDNIGAASAAAVGATDTDYVAIFEAGLS